MAASGRGSAGEGFSLKTEVLGAPPVLDHYWGRLGLSAWMSRAVGDGDGRSRLSLAKALRVAITNICIHHEPVYGLGKWAKGRDPKTMGLDDNDVSYLKDDRVGRAILPMTPNDSPPASATASWTRRTALAFSSSG